MDTAKYIMSKLKKEMDDVIIEETSNISGQLKFVNNKIAKTGTEQLKDISIFVVKKKKIVSTGFREVSGDAAENISNNLAASEKLTKKKADEVIEKIKKFIQFVEPKEDYYGIYKGKEKYKKYLEGYDSEIKDFDSVDCFEKAMNSALNEGAVRVSGILENHDFKKRIIASNGVDVDEKGTQFYLSLRALVNEKSSGHVNTVSRILRNFDVESVGKRAGEISVMAKDPVEFKEGKFDVIFDPLPLNALFSEVSSSLSMFNAEPGVSFLQSLR